MTIIPIMPLHGVVLLAVYDVTSVVYNEVVSVGAVLMSVPVVVVMMVPVVDSYLDLLSFGFDHNESWCSNGSSEEQRTNVAVYTVHKVVLPARDAQIRNPGSHYYALAASPCMSCSARV